MQSESAVETGLVAVAPNDRIDSIDVIRGMVLFGVLIVNLVTGFRVSIFQQFIGTTTPPTGLDGVIERIVYIGLESKAFCLFALLFGVGLAIQFDRLSGHGRPLYWLVRRLAVLLVFGLIHLLFVWNGDILTQYAVAGLVVLPLLLLRSQALLLCALGFLGLYVVGPVFLYLIPWPDATALQLHVTSANQAYSNGNFAEIWRFSLHELPLLLSLHVFVFPRTLALFLFGMFLWRAGVLKRPHDFRNQILIAATAGIAGGAALTAADALGSLRTLGTARELLVTLTPVLLALGYGATLLALTQLSTARGFLATFAPIGRMAFTNYVLQSFIFGFVFFGYGLGQFGRMGAAMAFAIGVVVYMVQLVFSKWWLHRYRFGPVEWLWRTLMYGVTQPMAKTACETPRAKTRSSF